MSNVYRVSPGSGKEPLDRNGSVKLGGKRDREQGARALESPSSLQVDVVHYGLLLVLVS